MIAPARAGDAGRSDPDGAGVPVWRGGERDLGIAGAELAGLRVAGRWFRPGR
ncbi:MAG TPA: hypothetical protein VN840_03880 [Streptosporangiaceae bacterium]|nr:hypothetical protein [Streptosporangiaceae bacterium]